jgi:hypothetical protein
MLRRDLGADVELEAGPYGSFEVRVDDTPVVQGGALAFLGVLPTLDRIRAQVAPRLDAAASGVPRRDDVR